MFEGIRDWVKRSVQSWFESSVRPWAERAFDKFLRFFSSPGFNLITRTWQLTLSTAKPVVRLYPIVQILVDGVPSTTSMFILFGTFDSVTTALSIPTTFMYLLGYFGKTVRCYGAFCSAYTVAQEHLLTNSQPASLVTIKPAILQDDSIPSFIMNNCFHNLTKQGTSHDEEFCRTLFGNIKQQRSFLVKYRFNPLEARKQLLSNPGKLKHALKLFSNSDSTHIIDVLDKEKRTFYNRLLSTIGSLLSTTSYCCRVVGGLYYDLTIKCTFYGLAMTLAAPAFCCSFSVTARNSIDQAKSKGLYEAINLKNGGEFLNTFASASSNIVSPLVLTVGGLNNTSLYAYIFSLVTTGVGICCTNLQHHTYIEKNMVEYYRSWAKAGDRSLFVIGGGILLASAAGIGIIALNPAMLNYTLRQVVASSESAESFSSLLSSSSIFSDVTKSGSIPLAVSCLAGAAIGG